MCKLSLIVDMGTSNTVIVERKQGRVVEEPTLIAVKKVGGKMRTVAVGKEAYKMKISKHKPQDVYYVYPVKDGNVVNSEAACLMLKAFIERITKLDVVWCNLLALLISGLITFTMNDRVIFRKRKEKK